jgi:hypothetical protein
MGPGSILTWPLICMSPENSRYFVICNVKDLMETHYTFSNSPHALSYTNIYTPQHETYPLNLTPR